jgi:AcrR family transcriptional regulator
LTVKSRKKKEATLHWVTTPKQARSQERLERLLDSAEEVIAEKGFEHASVAEIMGRAGSSVGLFYQRFKSKDDLLRCLLERFSDASIATADLVFDPANWKGKSIRAIVEQIIPFLVNVYRQRKGLIRAILLRASVDPEFNQSAHAAELHIADLLEKLCLDRVDQISHPDPRTAVRLAYQMLRCTLNSLALFELKQRAGFSLDHPVLEKELTRAILRLIGFRSSGAQDKGNENIPSKRKRA